MNEVTLHVESSIDAPRQSRSGLAPMKAKLASRFDDVLLVVSELVSNSVRHGASDGIDVKVIARAGRVRVEVTDEGAGFDESQPRGDGLGLTVVERVADTWGIQDTRQRFTVWAELSIRR